MYTQATFIELPASAAIESTTPTDGNNCLLYALSDNTVTSTFSKTIRNKLVSIAYKYRYTEFNGKTLDSWVRATSKLDFVAWARDFATNNAMSDQIVLLLWPIYKGEAVWVWQSQAGGYKHSHICRFGTSAQKVRHVVYRNLHYNALRIIESSVPERALTALKQVQSIQFARAYTQVSLTCATASLYTGEPTIVSVTFDPP